ncbi:MAG TPA: hypothetical protein VF466_00130 [Candidatus Saccharimonadales bacterium]
MLNVGLANMYPFVRNAAVEAELAAGATAAVTTEAAPVAPAVADLGDLAARNAALSERIAADKRWIADNRPTDMSHDLSLAFGLSTLADVRRQRAYERQHGLAA